MEKRGKKFPPETIGAAQVDIETFLQHLLHSPQSALEWYKQNIQKSSSFHLREQFISQLKALLPKAKRRKRWKSLRLTEYTSLLEAILRDILQFKSSSTSADQSHNIEDHLALILKVAYSFPQSTTEKGQLFYKLLLLLSDSSEELSKDIQFLLPKKSPHPRDKRILLECLQYGLSSSRASHFWKIGLCLGQSLLRNKKVASSDLPQELLKVWAGWTTLPSTFTKQEQQNLRDFFQRLLSSVNEEDQVAFFRTALGKRLFSSQELTVKSVHPAAAQLSHFPSRERRFLEDLAAYFSEVQKQLSLLQSERDQLQSERDQLLREREKQKEAIENLQKQLADLQDQYQRLQQETRQLFLTLSESQKKLDQWQSEAKILEAQLASELANKEAALKNSLAQKVEVPLKELRKIIYTDSSPLSPSDLTKVRQFINDLDIKLTTIIRGAPLEESRQYRERLKEESRRRKLSKET